MVITQFAIVMAFGALVAVVGLALLYLRKEQAENRIKLFGQEFQISTPALVVFLVGCAIFILPSVVPMQYQTAFSFEWPWRHSGTEQPDLAGVALASGEEREPNEKITAANWVKVGTTTKGVITSEQDRDFFKFKTGQGLKTRIILRKIPTHGFFAAVVVYDSTENRVKAGTAIDEDAVSFVFDSNPNTFYYVEVKGNYAAERGPYELLIKEE